MVLVEAHQVGDDLGRDLLGVLHRRVAPPLVGELVDQAVGQVPGVRLELGDRLGREGLRGAAGGRCRGTAGRTRSAGRWGLARSTSPGVGVDERHRRHDDELLARQLRHHAGHLGHVLVPGGEPRAAPPLGVGDGAALPEVGPDRAGVGAVAAGRRCRSRWPSRPPAVELPGSPWRSALVLDDHRVLRAVGRRELGLSLELRAGRCRPPPRWRSRNRRPRTAPVPSE